MPNRRLIRSASGARRIWHRRSTRSRFCLRRCPAACGHRGCSASERSPAAPCAPSRPPTSAGGSVPDRSRRLLRVSPSTKPACWMSWLSPIFRAAGASGGRLLLLAGSAARRGAEVAGVLGLRRALSSPREQRAQQPAKGLGPLMVGANDCCPDLVGRGRRLIEYALRSHLSIPHVSSLRDVGLC